MNKWQQVKLNDIVYIKTGKLDSNAAEANGIYPFFTCDPQTLRINSWAYDQEAVLLAGNNASGNYTAKYYNGKFNAYQRTYIICSKNENNLSTRFFAYALNLNLQYLKTISSGATTKFLTLSMLNNLSIPLPPIEVQRKIADVLSAYDDLIENNRKQIKLLEEAAQRLYKEWFIDLRFPGHETTKIVDGIPEGWERKTVGQLLNKFERTKQVQAADYLEIGLFPIIDQSRNFIAGYTNDAEALIQHSQPIIIFGDHTRVLKLISFPFAKGADGTQIIVSNNSDMPQHLFFCSLREIDLSNYHYARHFKYLKTEEILIPTKKIAQKIEMQLSYFFTKIQLCRNIIIQSESARNILLPKLMNGELEVNL